MAGCTLENNSKETIEINTSTNSGLTILCEHSLGGDKVCRFIRDMYTDNIYMAYYERHGYGAGGNLTPYYTAEGKIMNYTEFKTIHIH